MGCFKKIRILECSGRGGGRGEWWLVLHFEKSLRYMFPFCQPKSGAVLWESLLWCIIMSVLMVKCSFKRYTQAIVLKTLLLTAMGYLLVPSENNFRCALILNALTFFVV